MRMCAGQQTVLREFRGELASTEQLALQTNMKSERTPNQSRTKLKEYLTLRRIGEAEPVS